MTECIYWERVAIQKISIYNIVNIKEFSSQTSSILYEIYKHFQFPRAFLSQENITQQISVKSLNVARAIKKCQDSAYFANELQYKKISYVWSTNPENPKNISQKNIDNINKHMQLLLPEGYKFNIWINIDTLKFSEMNPNFPKGIETHEIKQQVNLTELEQNLLYNFTKYHTSFNGFRIDFSKYLILQEYGGFVLDLNFNFSAVPKEDFICIADSAIFSSTGITLYIENGALFAKKNNSIYQYMRKLTNEMLVQDSCLFKTLEKTGLSPVTDFFMSVLSLSFYTNCNTNEKNDFIIDTQEPSSKPQCFIDFESHNVYSNQKNINKLAYTEALDTIYLSDRQLTETDKCFVGEFYSDIINNLWPKAHSLFCLDYQGAESFGRDAKEMSWHHV